MTTDQVKLNPKGGRQHDHTKRGKVNATRDALERLLGQPHSEGNGTTNTAEWYLVTPHGSATIYNHWALNDEEYWIDAANDRAFVMVLEHLKANKLQAYCLYGEL